MFSVCARARKRSALRERATTLIQTFSGCRFALCEAIGALVTPLRCGSLPSKHLTCALLVQQNALSIRPFRRVSFQSGVRLAGSKNVDACMQSTCSADQNKPQHRNSFRPSSSQLSAMTTRSTRNNPVLDR